MCGGAQLQFQRNCLVIFVNLIQIAQHKLHEDAKLYVARHSIIKCLYILISIFWDVINGGFHLEIEMSVRDGVSSPLRLWSATPACCKARRGAGEIRGVCDGDG